VCASIVLSTDKLGLVGHLRDCRLEPPLQHTRPSLKLFRQRLVPIPITNYRYILKGDMPCTLCVSNCLSLRWGLVQYNFAIARASR
jgi:hypothetical protein